MAKSILSADSAYFPAFISPALAGLQPPPGGPRHLMAAHGTRLTIPTHN